MSHYTHRSARFDLEWSNVFFGLCTVQRIADDLGLDRSIYFTFETPFGRPNFFFHLVKTINGEKSGLIACARMKFSFRLNFD